MQKYIGIRVSPSKIFYTISTSKSYFNDVIVVPQFLSLPRQLSYIRTVLQSVITEQDIKIAGLRLAENIANAKKERVYIEGVIQEFFANSSIEDYEIFRLQNLAKRNDIPLGVVQQWIAGKESPEYVSNWGKFTKEHRESFLVVQALMKGDETSEG